MSQAYRQGASDYISEKLGTMGLVLGLQSFMPLKFKQQVKGLYTEFIPRTLTYFLRGSITVQLTSCLTGLDLTKLVNLYLILHKQLNPNQSNRRLAIQ